MPFFAKNRHTRSDFDGINIDFFLQNGRFLLKFIVQIGI